jgi:hypothetical protein
MSNRTGIYILIILLLNVVTTFIFDWHFTKAPLQQSIVLSNNFEASYQIYVPMAQTYDVDIDFMRKDKPVELLQKTLGGMTDWNEKGLPIKLYWEIKDEHNTLETHSVLSDNSCAWSNDYVSRCFGRFKLPAGSYLFKLKVLEIDPELIKFDTTINISYNFKSAHTWQTAYIFWGMLFNVFIAPVIAGIVFIIFLVRCYRHITRK